jgi:zinc protease
MAPEGTIALPEPESPFIAFNIWVKVGSQDDPAGKEGIAALTANLLSDGSTTADSYDAILEKLYPLASGYGYNVDKEMTVFTGRIHRDNLDAYYELFRNHLLAPAFKEEDFERVKSQTMNFLERTRRYGRDEELSRGLCRVGPLDHSRRPQGLLLPVLRSQQHRRRYRWRLPRRFYRSGEG